MPPGPPGLWNEPPAAVTSWVKESPFVHLTVVFVATMRNCGVNLMSLMATDALVAPADWPPGLTGWVPVHVVESRPSGAQRTLARRPAITAGGRPRARHNPCACKCRRPGPRRDPARR